MIDDDTQNQEAKAKNGARVILLTGMSGAGLSTALKAFEDSGYEAVDNLRLGLVPSLASEALSSGASLAVAVDTRNPNFTVEELLDIKRRILEEEKVDVHLVFLDCSDESLQRRYTETRRRHPLAADRPVTDGIRREREMLWRLREEADQAIDTSLLTIHDLRRLIMGYYPLETDLGLTIFITSFSFRHGVPREADIVLDARFLANPHWDVDLRPLTGQDERVAAYIRKDPDCESFIAHIEDFLVPLLPRYIHEGKCYLTIAVGCTGGRHRSVFIAEELATRLAQHDYIVGIGHRDLDRAANKP